MKQLKEAKDQCEFLEFLEEVAYIIDVKLSENPQLKSILIKSVGKLIDKAQQYEVYLRECYDTWKKSKAYKEAIKRGQIGPDGKPVSVYLAHDDLHGYSYFWRTEGRKPDPLHYLYCMIWGKPGEPYNEIDLEDYQTLLLVCIHDQQRISAGYKCIYFDPSDYSQLGNRICRDCYNRILGCGTQRTANRIGSLQQVIWTALLEYERSMTSQPKTNPFKNCDQYLTVPEIIDVLEIEPGSQKHKNLNSDLSKLKQEQNFRIKIEPAPRKQTDPRYKYDRQNKKFLDTIKKYKP